MVVSTRSLLVLTATGIGLFIGSASAQTADQSTNEVKRIIDHASYKEAVKFIDGDYDRVIAEGIKLTEIPAPPSRKKSARPPMRRCSRMSA